MNVLDVVVVATVALFCVKGYLNGLVGELFSLVILGAGLAASVLFYRPLANALIPLLENKDLSIIASFACIFICVTVLITLIRNGIRSIVDSVDLTDADSLLGAFVGLFKGVLLCGLVVIFLKNHAVLNMEKTARRSLFFPYIERTVVTLVSLLPVKAAAAVGRLLGL